jgi:DNA helicase-2/ATP-dependent DNA helicase PcrA
LRGESFAAPQKKKNLYTGKTYNSADAIAEFFKNRQTGRQDEEKGRKGEEDAKPRSQLSAFDRLKAAATPKTNASKPAPSTDAGFTPGSHVTHEKYGRGLVLRREGSGDNVKLTISFPGFGQKKLIEKFANLQKA